MHDRVILDALDTFPLGAAKPEGLVRAEARFLERARHWKPSEHELGLLVARAHRDFGLQASGTPKPRKTPRLYVAHVEFRANFDKRLVEGELQLLVRGRTSTQILSKLRRSLPAVRAEHQLPVEARFELMTVTEIREPIRDLVQLGGTLREFHGEELIAGKGWGGEGIDLRFKDDFPLLLASEPTKKTRPVVEMERSASGEHWIIRVANLPQYPFSAIGFPRTKRMAHRITNRLKRAFRRPISLNPPLRDLHGFV